LEYYRQVNEEIKEDSKLLQTSILDSEGTGTTKRDDRSEASFDSEEHTDDDLDSSDED